MSKDDVENEEKNNSLKKFEFEKYPKCISYYLVPKTPPNPTPSKLHSIFMASKPYSSHSINSPNSPPNLIRILLPLRLRNPRSNKHKAQHRHPCKDKEHPALAPKFIIHPRIQKREKLRHNERRNVITCQTPTLSRTHGFLSYKLAGNHEWHGTETCSEQGDEQ